MTAIGIIGCGKIAERHILAYRKLPVRIIIADASPDVARSLADQYRVEYRENPEDILADTEITATDICVPTACHREMIIRSLAGGKHCFCEKPLCGTLREAKEIREAAARSDRVLMVGFLQRFHPAFRVVKEALDSGAIGTPYLSLFRVGGRGNAATWKHQRATSGGVVLELLVHKLDQIVWFFGPPERVDVLVGETLRPIRTVHGQTISADAEDLVVLDMQARGTRVICEADFITPSYMDHMEIQGENGSIFSSLLHFMPTIIHCNERRGIYNQGSNFQNFPMVNLFELELAHFLQVIESKVQNTNSLQDSIYVTEIIERIWDSLNRFGPPGGQRWDAGRTAIDSADTRQPERGGDHRDYRGFEIGQPSGGPLLPEV
ncbi:MAG: Gfo/Idh/MocA family oxidoreductase [Acidobacteria bacterium]|nr:Gfo/Idh/MocA family oxidoreductase [Acidobacteriota bacterium]